MRSELPLSLPSMELVGRYCVHKSLSFDPVFFSHIIPVYILPPYSLISILMLPFHMSLGVPGGVFPAGSSIINLVCITRPYYSQLNRVAIHSKESKHIIVY
jgi:hypothetical protein